MAENRASDEQTNGATQGITSIAVRGFKSLAEECVVEIRPLTLLAGANSSGKSSAIQPLLLLKQTLEASYDPGALLLYGPNVRFTSAEQLLSNVDGNVVTDEFTVCVEFGERYYFTDRFQNQKKQGLELVEMALKTEHNVITLRPEMPHEQVVAALPEEFDELRRNLGQSLHESIRWTTNRIRCFIEIETLSKPSNGVTVTHRLSLTSNPYESCIRGVIHVPGLRGNPERTYKTTAVGHQFAGVFENYVASIVHHWQMTKDHRLTALGNALELLGLTWKVDASQVDDVQVELRVGRLPQRRRGDGKDMVNIADVGFGVSQVLPVLVALLTAEPGQLVYLEQPELHLHPRAQAALAQVLVDAANRGVRVVAETHSALLLLSIQALVAEGQVAPDKIKLHWFKRRDDGTTHVTSADIDEAGAFGDWPEDFADVMLETESRYLDAAASHYSLTT